MFLLATHSSRCGYSENFSKKSCSFSGAFALRHCSIAYVIGLSFSCGYPVKLFIDKKKGIMLYYDDE